MRAIFLAAFAVCGGLCAQPIHVSVDDFLEKVINEDIADQVQNARLYFSPGDKHSVPLSVQKLMVHLSARGVETHGTIVTRDQLELEALGVSTEPLVYDISGLEKAVFPSIAELFGVPNGMSALRSIHPLKPLKEFESEVKQIFATTLAVHNLVLLTGLALAQKITLVPLAVLSTYFYEVFGNFTEVLRFKGQGKIVVKRGADLNIETNPYFIFLANFIEEMGINGAMGATIPSEGGLSIQDTLESSFAFGLAKTSVDRYAAQMEIKRQAALGNGDTASAKSIRDQQLFVMNAFFNGVVPIVRTLALLTKETAFGPACSALKGGMIAAAGCYSIYEELSRIGRLQFLPKEFLGKGCARALVVFYREKPGQ